MEIGRVVEVKVEWRSRSGSRCLTVHRETSNSYLLIYLFDSSIRINNKNI